MTIQGLYIDIYLGGTFYRQLPFLGTPEVIGGRKYYTSNVQSYVLSQLPSLRGKDYKIRFSKQQTKQ